MQLRYFYRLSFCRAIIQRQRARSSPQRLLHDETYYMLVRDHFSNALYGTALPFKLPPLSGSPNGLPPRAPDLRSIPNMFGWTFEENLVASKKSLTCCLLRHGTQSMAPNSSYEIGPIERPRRDVDIRSGLCSPVPHWPLTFGRMHLSFPPTRPHDADLVETICQIRGDELDGARSHELVHHIHGEELRFTRTYASCIDQSCMRLFFALSAMSFVVMSADCTNAHTNAPSPTQPAYARIDDAHASCCR
jgi:hypothetical protein